jgi:glycosyltransferase involved in cell wall biosynthesis
MLKETANRADLRVAIDAQLLPWRNGGVTHALVALIHSLGQLRDGREHYCVVVATQEEANYWGPILGPNQELILKPASDKKADARTIVGLAKKLLRPAFHRLQDRLAKPRYWPEIPLSDGFYESLRCDVLHIPYQAYFLCSMPTVYNPHDLQHLHLPQFWPPQEIAFREITYSMGCRLARTIVTGSQWAKDDIVRQYCVDPNKVQVIPEGPLDQQTRQITRRSKEEVRQQYNLPEEYLLYPAVTWQHKNHLNLLEAIAHLRDSQGIKFPLVCTGAHEPEFWPQIQERIQALRLQQQVQFLGFLPEADLRVVQECAFCLVQPSLFEASSLPIYDAWIDGVPVACSRVTALPDQVRDAGLLFDPKDVADIANAIRRVVTSEELRDELRKRGHRRVKDFNWERTARAYRACYRQAAARALTDEDKSLLNWDWMREPERLAVSAYSPLTSSQTHTHV